MDVAAVQADPSVGLGEGAIDNSPKLDAAWFAVHVAAVCRGLWRARSMHHWIEEAALSVERCGQRKSHAGRWQVRRLHVPRLAIGAVFIRVPAPK